MSAPVGHVCLQCGALVGVPCDPEDPSWSHAPRWQALKGDAPPQPWADAYGAWRLENQKAFGWPVDAFRAGWDAASKSTST